MLADLMTWLRNAAEKRGDLRLQPVPGNPTQIIGVLDGQRFDVELQPRERMHTLHSLESLVAMAADEQIAAGPAGREVYVGEERIVMVLDRGDRRELAVMPLEGSDRWRILWKHNCDPVAYSVAEFDRLLRYGLRCEETLALSKLTGHLDFARQTGASAGAGHGKESLGRSVEARVQKADQIPEVFRIPVQPFVEDGVNRTVQVEMGLFLNPGQERIELQVMPGELDKAIAAVMRETADWLRRALPEGTPVFVGDFEAPPVSGAGSNGSDED